MGRLTRQLMAEMHESSMQDDRLRADRFKTFMQNNHEVAIERLRAKNALTLAEKQGQVQTEGQLNLRKVDQPHEVGLLDKKIAGEKETVGAKIAAEQGMHADKIAADRAMLRSKLGADVQMHGERIAADKEMLGSRISADERISGSKIAADISMNNANINAGRDNVLNKIASEEKIANINRQGIIDAENTKHDNVRLRELTDPNKMGEALPSRQAILQTMSEREMMGSGGKVLKAQIKDENEQAMKNMTSAQKLKWLQTSDSLTQSLFKDEMLQLQESLKVK